MTFAEVMAKLAAQEGGEDMVAAITAETTKKNKEAEGLRTRAKTAETALKAATDNYKTMLKTIGVADEDAAAEDFSVDDALEAYVNKAGEGKGKAKDSPEFIEMSRNFKNLQRQVEKLSKENGEFKTSAETERAQRHDMLKKTALRTALEAGKAIKPDFLADALAGKVKVGDDGKVYYMADDGAEVGVDEGVKGWLAANPDLVVNPNGAGAGSAGGGKGGAKDAELGKSLADERNKAQVAAPAAGGINPWAVSSQGTPQV